MSEGRMHSKKFDPAKLAKLNDPGRLTYLDPDLMWERLSLGQPSVLVDIGAGTGFFSFIFGRRLKGGRVFACDISGVMIEWMGDHIPPELRDVVVPVEMSEDSIPLPDGIADLAYMINVHHELEAPGAIISEAARLLRAGGKVMIVDWKDEETPEGPPRAIRVSADTIIGQLRGLFPRVLRHDVLPYHHFIVGEKGG